MKKMSNTRPPITKRPAPPRQRTRAETLALAEELKQAGDYIRLMTRYDLLAGIGREEGIAVPEMPARTREKRQWYLDAGDQLQAALGSEPSVSTTASNTSTRTPARPTRPASGLRFTAREKAASIKDPVERAAFFERNKDEIVAGDVGLDGHSNWRDRYFAEEDSMTRARIFELHADEIYAG